ncbi:MAG: beta-ketoacyl synthase chain length factor [Pikeienuella sp.]
MQRRAQPMKPVPLFLDRIGFAASGATGWGALKTALAEGGWRHDPDWSVAPLCLAPRAARRLSPQIRLALAVAEQLGEMPAETGYVFASSVGEGETLKIILDALRTEEMLIQPLRFQNAVFNAASGQWTIATRRQGPATSVAAYDQTFGAGLMKTVMQIALERRPVGLVCYDAPFPQPLHPARPMAMALGAGFAFSPAPTGDTIAALTATLGDARPSAPQSGIGREMLASGNPIAQAMCLLEPLARGERGKVTVALDGSCTLTLEITAP